ALPGPRARQGRGPPAPGGASAGAGQRGKRDRWARWGPAASDQPTGQGQQGGGQQPPAGPGAPQGWGPRPSDQGGAPPQGQGQGHGQGHGQQSGQSQGSQQGQGQGQGQDEEEQPPAWGSQWSSRQPGRSSGGGFGASPSGGRPGAQRGQSDQGNQNGQKGKGGSRWDPTDPAQRRARYSLLSGMWAFFFALFSLPEIALLLGALALYWGISALRAKQRRPEPAAAAVDAPPPAPDATSAPLPAPKNGNGSRQQSTAAISGVVTGGIALAIVIATYTFQLVYSDYYTCTDDALTKSSRQTCDRHLPEPLRPILDD
ncbi:hypothetical protein, partial [Streptomyces youssoufiensis]